MLNPYPRLPKDESGQTMQEYPSPSLANTRYGSENGTASSVITVQDTTSAIEIAAVGGAAVMRWVARADTQGSVISAAATANFDHVIPSGMMRRFALPIETTYQNPGSIVGVNTMNGLYQRVAIKTVGVASVLLTEY